MAELSGKRVGLSLGIVGVIFSLVCALFVLSAPAAAIRIFGSIFHGIDFATIMKPSFTVGELFTGLVVIFVIGYLGGALYAWVYNRLSGR